MFAELSGGSDVERIGRRQSSLKHADVSDMVAELREGDGVDPKRLKRQEKMRDKDGVREASRARLCSQAKHALEQSLPAELGDLQIRSVTQSGGSKPLEVTLEPGPTANLDEFKPSELLITLERAKPALRAAVAEAINRKKTPDLSFTIIGRTGDGPDQ
jgi:hypothetical protein